MLANRDAREDSADELLRSASNLLNCFSFSAALARLADQRAPSSSPTGCFNRPPPANQNAAASAADTPSVIFNESQIASFINLTDRLCKSDSASTLNRMLHCEPAHPNASALSESYYKYLYTYFYYYYLTCQQNPAPQHPPDLLASASRSEAAPPNAHADLLKKLMPQVSNSEQLAAAAFRSFEEPSHSNGPKKSLFEQPQRLPTLFSKINHGESHSSAQCVCQHCGKRFTRPWLLQGKCVAAIGQRS